MPYFLETDAFHELPVWEVLAGGNADRIDQLQAAYVRLKSLASHLQKDGYLTADGALRQCRGRRQVLEKFCTPVLEEQPLLHRPGDECHCLGERPWVQGFAYRIHEFLKRNPSKREYDRNKAQKADLNDARLKSQVFQRDGGCCRYCTSGPLSAKAGRSRDRRKVLQFDHVDPDQAAGADASNLVAACARCNEYKGKRTPDEADMKLLPVPDPEVAEAMRRRPQELHDQAPDIATNQQTITGEPAPNQPNNDQQQPPDQQSGSDPTTDPITDHQPDPVADSASPVRPKPTTQMSEQRPEPGSGGSGSGRAGPPDLVQPQPPHPGQPLREPAYPDIYTGRSRPAPPREISAVPDWPPTWPPDYLPANPHEDQPQQHGGTQ
jgi:HNH endonuclease